MSFKNQFCISDCRCADELIKLDWPSNLLIKPEDCKIYLDHCKKYNMKFLDESYGTVVHKTFNDYFEYIPSSNDEEYEIQAKLTCQEGFTKNYTIDGVNIPLDHVNLFRSKIYEDVYMVTSSPYDSLNETILEDIKKYPYEAFIVNPNFLDYHGFIMSFGIDCMRHPLWNVNYAFTNATLEQMYEITTTISKDIEVFPVFMRLPR